MAEQHGQTCIPEHLPGDATQGPFAEAATAVGTQHQQVGMEAVRLFEQSLARIVAGQLLRAGVDATPVEVDLDARIRLSELIGTVVDLVGADGMKLLLEGEAGYTEAESDERRHPGSPSTGALRKRLARAGREIAARINHDLEGDR